MHDIRAIRENPEAFDDGLARRGLPPRAELLIALDERRRAAIARFRRRRSAATPPRRRSARRWRARTASRPRFRAEVAAAKAKMPELEAAEREAAAALETELAAIPNLPLDDVPDGKDENDNVELRRWGAPPSCSTAYKPQEHFEIGEALGLMDFETAAKLSGARFVVLKGALARLERALEQFMLDLHTRSTATRRSTRRCWCATRRCSARRNCRSFATISSWLLKCASQQELRALGAKQRLRRVQSLSIQKHEFETVRTERALEGSCRLRLEAAAQIGERRWLIPTAEVPLTNLVRESIVDEKTLPLRFTAGTLCFRAEAGAAGKDTRGMIRQHQFEKVELVSITTPEQSRDEHERMTACAEEVLKRLGLHLPHHRALHRRHGLRLAEDLRHRSLAAGAGAVPRNFVVLGLRRLPGAADERALQGGGRQDRPASSTRSTARASPSAARWSRCWRTIRSRTARSRSRGAAALHGRPDAHRALTACSTVGGPGRGPPTSSVAGPDQLMADIVCRNASYIGDTACAAVVSRMLVGLARYGAARSAPAA